MYRKNTASQFICFQMLLTATGAVATGLSPATRRCIDGTFAAGGGTATEDGTTGSYKYAMSQADTNGNDISFIFSAATAMPVCVNIVTTAADPTDSVRLGLTALPNAGAGATNGLPLSVDSSGRVDVLKINGTSQTARDIGASVLLSTGTGTGQLDFTSGVVKANATQILGGAIPAVTTTGVPKVDIVNVNGDTTAGPNLAKTTRAIGRCTASGVPTTTSIPTSACAPAGAVADQFKGRIITFDADTTTTALRGQATDITASSNAATPTFTVTALTTAPVSGDTFSIT